MWEAGNGEYLSGENVEVQHPPLKREQSMPRYVVERTFPDGLIIPIDEVGAQMCHSIVSHNAQEFVTWLLSYVSEDKQKTYCIYDGPSPEAIRQAARSCGLPVERITEVRVLDPYFYS